MGELCQGDDEKAPTRSRTNTLPQQRLRQQRLHRTLLVTIPRELAELLSLLNLLEPFLELPHFRLLQLHLGSRTPRLSSMERGVTV